MNSLRRWRTPLAWLVLAGLALKLSGLGQQLGALIPGYRWLRQNLCSVFSGDNSTLNLLLKDNPLQHALWGWLHTPTLASIKFCLLQLTTTPVVYQPEQWIVGTPAFAIQVFPYCSGLEGLFLLALMITVICWRQPMLWRYWPWLILLAGLLCWLAAILRLTLLILIGSQQADAALANHLHTELGWLLLLGMWLFICKVCHALTLRLPESPAV